MALLRWFADRDPFSEWDRLMRQVDQSMRVMFRPGIWPGVYPPLNVSEDGENIYVRAEMPGVDAKDIELSLEGESLILRGERKIEAAQGVDYHRRERTAGVFRRVITLPVPVDSAKVEASFKNGVLKVRLPKAEEAKPRQIKVTAA